MIFTGDSITGEEAYRFGMANYCVPEEDIDEFTEIFAKRVALIPWQYQSIENQVKFITALRRFTPKPGLFQLGYVSRVNLGNI